MPLYCSYVGRFAPSASRLLSSPPPLSYSIFSWKCSFFLNWEDLCLEKKKKKAALVRFPGFSATPKITMLITNTKEHREKRDCSSLTERIKRQASLCKRWGNRMHLPCGFILVNFWHWRMLTLTRQLWKTKVNKPSRGIRGRTQPKSRQWSYACQTAILLFVLKIYLATLRILNAMEERIMSVWFFQSTVWRSNQTERVSNNSKGSVFSLQPSPNQQGFQLHAPNGLDSI